MRKIEKKEKKMEGRRLEAAPARGISPVERRVAAPVWGSSQDGQCAAAPARGSSQSGRRAGVPARGACPRPAAAAPAWPRSDSVTIGTAPLAPVAPLQLSCSRAALLSVSMGATARAPHRAGSGERECEKEEIRTGLPGVTASKGSKEWLQKVEGVEWWAPTDLLGCAQRSP